MLPRQLTSTHLRDAERSPFCERSRVAGGIEEEISLGAYSQALLTPREAGGVRKLGM
jgi:hypothetical protein